MCPSPRIEPHHLPPELFRGASKSPQKPYESLQEARSAYEREFVLRKLEENRWNMTKAAAAWASNAAISTAKCVRSASPRPRNSSPDSSPSRVSKRHSRTFRPRFFLFRFDQLPGFENMLSKFLVADLFKFNPHPTC